MGFINQFITFGGHHLVLNDMQSGAEEVARISQPHDSFKSWKQDSFAVLKKSGIQNQHEGDIANYN